MVRAGPVKLGRVAGRGGGVHGCPALQRVGMEVTVISRLTLKLHAIVCAQPLNIQLADTTSVDHLQS